MNKHTKTRRINVTGKATVVATVLTARVTKSDLDIQVTTEINEVHMLTIVRASTLESFAFLSYLIQLSVFNK